MRHSLSLTRRLLYSAQARSKCAYSRLVMGVSLQFGSSLMSIESGAASDNNNTNRINIRIVRVTAGHVDCGST